MYIKKFHKNTGCAREMYTNFLNIAHELKGRGLKTKHMWIGYMIKFIIRATWVSKSFHQKHYTQSC
jgi:hypothetical protein